MLVRQLFRTDVSSAPSHENSRCPKQCDGRSPNPDGLERDRRVAVARPWRVFNGVSSLIRNWCSVACIKAQVLVNGRDGVELAEMVNRHRD